MGTTRFAVFAILPIVACTSTCSRLRQPVEPPPHQGPLTVAVNADPDRGDAPLTVQFTAEVYEGDAARDPQFVWDFGDGSRPAKGETTRHTYRNPGRYVARVQVSDRFGRRGEDEVEISVEPLE